MTTPETKVKAKLKKLLKVGGYWFSSISDRYHSGLPDVIAIRSGLVYFIEVKSSTGKLTRLQTLTLEEAKRHGAICVVYRGEDELISL